MTQNNLGLAYSFLPAGDRRANLGKAIACFEAALRVCTESDFPEQWAKAQNSLGAAYGRLPTGNRGANLRQAIAWQSVALERAPGSASVRKELSDS